MTRSIGIGAAALLFAAGCGGDGGADRIDNAAEFCAALLDAWAAKVADCNTWTVDAARREISYTVLPCERIEEAAAAGHVGFDAPQAEVCLAELSAITCWRAEHEGVPPEECALAVPPLVAVGGTCFADVPIECIGGYCEFQACNAPGACKAHALLGELCETDPDHRRCADHLDCDYGTYRCAERTPPTMSGPGESCASGEICAEGLYCASTGFCTPQGTGACEWEGACVRGYRCSFEETCTTIKSIGQACTTGIEDCLHGAYCQAPQGSETGVCTAWSGVGGACGEMGNYEEAWCVESWCEEGMSGLGTCRPHLGLGASCDSWEACGPSALCDGGTCAKAYCLK